MISNSTSINHPHLFNRVLGCAVVLVGGVFFHAKADAQLAQAQSLQLYGLLDVGYVHVSGLKDGTFNGVSSGVMEGSRWGVKGLEDMGGGYKAVFTLESRLEIDTGTMSNTPYSGGQLPDRIATAAGLGLMSPNPSVNAMYQAATAAIGMQLGSTLGANLQSRLFDRQSMAGLITPYGAFLMGVSTRPLTRCRQRLTPCKVSRRWLRVKLQPFQPLLIFGLATRFNTVFKKMSCPLR